MEYFDEEDDIIGLRKNCDVCLSNFWEECPYKKPGKICENFIYDM